MDKRLYKIYLTTSNFQHANSISNVNLQLFGKHNRVLKSFKFPLEKSKNNLKKFQPGQTDLFEVEEDYIGNLKKIVLTHNDKQSSGLHIKNIRIEVSETNESWNFYCNQWLKSELTLTKHDQLDVEKTSRQQITGNIRYTIKIITSQCTKINFDPVINIKLIGHNETRFIKLNSTPSDNNKPKFQSGNIDIFRLEEKDVGQIEKIVLLCENDSDGKMIDWFYDSITIDVPTKLLRYLFDRSSNTQVYKSEKDTTIELYPKNVKKISDQKNYCINLYTNKLRLKPEIFEQMSMILYGDYAISSEIKPSEFKTSCNCKNSLNDELIHFHLKRADLGHIYKIKIICTLNKKQAKDLKNFKWFLNKIEIDYHKEIFVFLYKKSIDFKKYDLGKKIEIKIFEQGYSRDRTRTICTLSHRLLEESIKNDSYDDSFDESGDDKKIKERKKSVEIDKAKLRFDQDLEELASSDSTLSIVSSNSNKSSPKKRAKSSVKTKWSSDDDSFKSKYRNEWSDDDDSFRSNRKMSNQSPKLRSKSEWSSDESPRFKVDERPIRNRLADKIHEEKHWDEKPIKSRPYEPGSSRRDFEERPIRSSLADKILEEKYGNDKPIKNRLNEKLTYEPSSARRDFEERPVRNWDDKPVRSKLTEKLVYEPSLAGLEEKPIRSSLADKILEEKYGKQNWDETPIKNRLNEKLTYEPSSARRDFEERPVRKSLADKILEEKYGKENWSSSSRREFEEKPLRTNFEAPQFSSSLMNKLKTKQNEPDGLVKNTMRSFNDRFGDGLGQKRPDSSRYPSNNFKNF